MALPSGYEYANAVYRGGGLITESPYFDLGFVASSDIDIGVLFYVYGGDARMNLFGARETNSNSSAKQLNLFFGGSTTSYLGYAGARNSLGTTIYKDDAETTLQKDANVFTLNVGNQDIHEITGATTSFEGTRNMFLFSMNNAGTSSPGTAVNYGVLFFAQFVVDLNSERIHNFIPVYDVANNEQCLYDTVTDTIIQKSGSGGWIADSDLYNTHYLLTLESTEGGYAYAETRYGAETTKIYLSRHTSFIIDEGLTYYRDWYGTRITAYEKSGYSFVGWEKDGQIVSRNRTTTVMISEATTLKAVFTKNDEDDPKNTCYLMCYKYGQTADATVREKEKFLAFAPVISASIKVDGVSKTTSTIEVKEIPDGVQTDCPVILRNPKGKTMYFGVIKSIVDKTLTCREPLSLFDSEYMFGSTKTSTLSVMHSMIHYMALYSSGYPSYKNNAAELNASIERKMEPYYTTLDDRLTLEKNANINITAPVIDSTNVSNLEDYLLKNFDEFGIYVEPSYGNTEKWIGLEVSNPKKQSPLVLSDNSEALTDITVDVQEMENTSLVVYNSAGTTFRGIYSVKEDGTITNYNYPPTSEEEFIAYNSCKPKVVMTDDNIKTVVEQYLSNAKYNHKITFNLDLDSDLYSLDALNIGRRVTFYYKNKIYNSIVTGLEWELPTNMEDPHTVKVILGKVRNKLTTKLNLGKVKR